MKQPTQQEFDQALAEIVEEESANMLTIPGIYEVLSEYFNDDAIDRAVSNRGAR